MEWHKSHNKSHITSAVVQYGFDRGKPKTNWKTNQSFLEDFLPIVKQSEYVIEHLEKLQQQSISALVKHHWLFHSHHHFYINAGIDYTHTSLRTSESQTLADGSTHNFEAAGFGNDMTYRLNDIYTGLDYKFMIKSRTHTASLSLHHYTLQSLQTEEKHKISRYLIEPKWHSKWQINNSESLTFNYAYQNKFPHAKQLATGYRLEGYNSVYKGNALLKNEKYHNASFLYRKFSAFNGLSYFGFLRFNKKERSIRNQVVLDGVERFQMPFLMDTPETNWIFSGDIQKDLNVVRAGLHPSWNVSDFTQTINSELQNTKRESVSTGVSIRTIWKYDIELFVKYNKSFSRFAGVSTSKYTTDSYTASIEYSLLKNWSFQGYYEYYRNTNKTQNSRKDYSLAEVSLEYQLEDSPWIFQLTAQNLWNDKTKNNTSISDYLVMEQTTHILPRIVLLGVQYKI